MGNVLGLRRLLGSLGLMAACLSLLGLVGVFDARAAAIALEGNSLRSGRSVIVRDTLRSLRAQASALGPDARVFVEVDGRAVQSVIDLGKGAAGFPLHAGRGLGDSSGPAALVGADVATDRAGGSDVVVVGERAYPVIGGLGRRSDGFLNSSIIVNDPALFSDEPERLILDGSTAADAYVASHGEASVERPLSGANRRTNIDVVTPILVAVGTSVSALGVVAAGLRAGVAARPATALRIVAGSSRRAVAAGALVRFCCGGAIGAVVAIAVTAVVARGTAVELGSGFIGVFVECATAVLAAWMALVVRRGGPSSWS